MNYRIISAGDDRWDAGGGRKGAALGRRRSALDRGGVLMWASDLPHPDSTWPDSQRPIEENVEGIAATIQQRILCDNAKASYGLS